MTETRTIKLSGTDGATICVVPLGTNPDVRELPPLTGVTGTIVVNVDTWEKDEFAADGTKVATVGGADYTVEGHIDLTPAGRQWITDLFLCNNHTLAGIRGTAAHGRVVGQTIQAGEPYIAATDRERRFVGDQLRWRGLALDHIHGTLHCVVPASEETECSPGFTLIPLNRGI